MAGRGPMSFQKRQKELKRKEKREEKLARKVQKKDGEGSSLLTAVPLEPMDDDPLDDAEISQALERLSLDPEIPEDDD